MKNKEYLRVSELDCGYGSTFIVGSLSFTLYERELLLAHGPNGVGKTTMMNTLASLIPPLHGKIELSGIDIRKARKRIFYLIEKVDVPPELNGVDYVMAVMSLYGKPILSEAVKALEEVGVINMRGRLGRMSQGQRRRVQLASALVSNAKLYLFDDPSIGLDDIGIKETMPKIFKKLIDKDAIIVLTTKDRLLMGEITPLAKEAIDITIFSHLR